MGTDDHAQPPGGPVFPGTPMHPSGVPPPGPDPARSGRAPRSQWPVLLAALAGIVAVCCFGGIAVVAVSLPGEPSGDVPSAGSEPATGGLGTAVRDGQLEFVVHRIRCGVSSVGQGRDARPADGQFCLVHLSVENVGDRPRMFNDVEQQAFGRGGVEYGADRAAGALANRDTDVHLRQVNPGNRIDGVLVFDIPPERELTRLRLHDSRSSPGAEVTLE